VVGDFPPTPTVLKKEIVWFLFSKRKLFGLLVPAHSLSGYCTNEALVCRPEMSRFRGPPECSEGGEGHRMVGPLCARWRLRIVVS
jgi:hypothetical protein